MKIIHLSKLIIFFVAIVNLTSCSQNPLVTNQKSEIRFVDLQGNPRKIRLNTPSENVDALTEQGKISQTKIIEEENYKQSEVKEKELSYNKYGDDNQKQPQALKDPKKNGLIYTMNLPTEENKPEEIRKPEKEATNAPVEEEYDLAKTTTKIDSQEKTIRGGSGERIISETKIPSASSKTKEIQSGTYVQVGSFTKMTQAERQLNTIKKITNNPGNVKIQSAKVKNKNYYRVVIGPITKKQTAKLLTKDLKRKGQNSIIIKIK